MKIVTGLDDFYAYCKKRRDYICLVFLAAIAIYGVWLMQDFVTFDAEGFYSAEYSTAWYEQWMILGRWFFVALKKALGVTLINPFFSAAVFLICFPLSGILWGYLFTCWTQEDGRSFGAEVSRGQIVFDLLYLSHPVWAHQFAYRNQMEVISLIMVLMPVALLLAAKWIKQNSVPAGIAGFVLVVLCFGSYQSFVIVYISGLMIFLLLQVLCDQINHKQFWIQVLKICVFSILAYICYSRLSALFCTLAGLDRRGYSSYLLGQISWGTKPLSENLESTGAFLKMIFFGDSDTYTFLYGAELIFGIILLVLYQFRKNPLWKRIWIVLLFLGTILSAQLIDLMTAGSAVIRQEFAYVLTLAFIGLVEWNILFRLLEGKVNRLTAQLVCGALLVCIFLNQLQVITRLLYSDYRSSTSDYERMSELYYDALEAGASPGSAIAFVGARDDDFDDNTVDREIIGQSYFTIVVIAPDKLAQAMRAYGFDVTVPTEEQQEYAESIKDELLVYPNENSMRIEPGLIIVRLS